MIPPGRLLTVLPVKPDPARLTDNVGKTWTTLKVATGDSFAVRVIVQVEVPLHPAPLQPAKVEPAEAAAVSVT